MKSSFSLLVSVVLTCRCYTHLQGNGSTTSVGIAQRARHPDELKRDNGNWIVDIDYYLAQQVFVVYLF